MKLLTPVALVAALTFAAAPAQAQQHRSGGGGQRSGGGSQRSASRGGGPSGPRVAQSGRPVYRSGGYRVVGPRVYYGSRAYSGAYYGGGARYYSPYYSFRPHVSVGFGLWLGYPVTYPYYYGYPYGYPYPPDPYGYARPSYGYPPQPYPSSNQSQYPSSNDDPDYGPSGQNYPAQQSAPSIGVQRGDQSAPGGVSFEITPDNAAIFVDGTYIGTANEFSPTSQPLGLVSGHHRIEIRASGYRTMTFDTDITSGQVLPYQGTLQRN